MIYETVISTTDKLGKPHIAPMGIRISAGLYVIAPFKPSKTLENLLERGQAVINMVDDVSIVAGCLTGRKEWSVIPAETIEGVRLEASLAHIEVEVECIEEDELRPAFHCRELCSISHQPFRGFNRAQAAVIEAAILVSRLGMLPEEKIKQEIDYLQIAIDKTAGEREKTAWSWLMAEIDNFRESNKEVQSR